MNYPSATYFDLANLNGLMVRLLIPHLGPPVTGANFGPFLVALLEKSLYPYTDYDDNHLLGLLGEYNISLETGYEVVGDLTPMVHRMVTTVYGGLIGDYLFTINQISPDTAMVSVDGPIPEEQSQSIHGVDDWVKGMQREIENGDYIPESMRRLAGLA